jgi:uncharacterized membrane protein YgcG
MKRLAVTLAGLVVLAIAVLWPTVQFGTGGPADTDTTTITDYVADFTVADNGDLAVTETLTVDFPDGSKHGIFRFWDRSDPSAPHARRDPRDISVTMDGSPEEFDRTTQSGGRYVVARIGDPDVTLFPGNHTYTISYRIDGVLEPGTDGAQTQFYWNLIPGGWAQEIDKADLTVHLPAKVTSVSCAEGVGATGGCSVRGSGTRNLEVVTGRLDPRTPVTIKAGLPIATPPTTSIPWTTRFDPVLGDSVPALVIILLLAAVAGAVGLVVAHSTHERKPAFPLQYAPPDGLGPAEAMYVVTEQVDNKAFVASLLWAAQQGAIDLKRDGDAWTITDKGGAEGWAKVDPVTASVAPLLGGAGGQFQAKRGDVTSGKTLQARISAFEAETRDWGRTNGYLARAGLGSAGTLLVIAAGIGVLGLGIFNWAGMSVLALVPGAFAVAALPLLLPTAATKRTATGRDLWSRLGGFRRVLSTPSSKERFDFSGRQELYTAYIPWAVAFGCADEWAKKYRTEVGTEPPIPAYFGGLYAGDHTGNYVSQMVGDFSSAVSSSISAYEATQSHSSGGGGGFSGGGGGGGGGGGSW